MGDIQTALKPIFIVLLKYVSFISDKNQLLVHTVLKVWREGLTSVQQFWGTFFLARTIETFFYHTSPSFTNTKNPAYRNPKSHDVWV